MALESRCRRNAAPAPAIATSLGNAQQVRHTATDDRTPPRKSITLKQQNRCSGDLEIFDRDGVVKMEIEEVLVVIFCEL